MKWMDQIETLPLFMSPKDQLLVASLYMLSSGVFRPNTCVGSSREATGDAHPSPLTIAKDYLLNLLGQGDQAE